MEEQKQLNTFSAHEERKNRDPEHIVVDKYQNSGKAGLKASQDTGPKLVDVVVLNDYCHN